MKLITNPDTSTRRIAAVGMYDGVHLGHRFLIDYLRTEARSRGLETAVVTFPRHPLSLLRPLEAPALLTSLEDRVRLIDEAGADNIILLSFTDKLRKLSAEEFLRMLRRKYGIDALVLGFNNHFGNDRLDNLAQYRETGAKVGVDVIPAPEYRGEYAPVSSSSIRRCLAEGKPDKAAEGLGRYYSLRGRVVTGNRLGRTLGFATANIVPADPSALIPRSGVYAAYVITPDGVRRPAMVNIGHRPTVSGDADGASAKLSVEAHILDYIGYLYDEDITLEFVRYMRPERRFSSTAKLAEQLAADAREARRLLS